MDGWEWTSLINGIDNERADRQAWWTVYGGRVQGLDHHTLHKSFAPNDSWKGRHRSRSTYHNYFVFSSSSIFIILFIYCFVWWRGFPENLHCILDLCPLLAENNKLFFHFNRLIFSAEAFFLTFCLRNKHTVFCVSSWVISAVLHE